MKYKTHDLIKDALYDYYYLVLGVDTKDFGYTICSGGPFALSTRTYSASTVEIGTQFVTNIFEGIIYD